MHKAQNPAQKTALQIWWGLAILLVGFGLLLGALISISSGAWPMFMPVQLDIFGALFGAYVGGAVAFMLGAFLVWAGCASIWRNK
jgi:hypothetical protein